MPAYDYECQECGERFSRRVAVAERDEQRCPRCGAARVRRLLSAPMVLGSGAGGAAGGGGGCGGGAGFG